MDYTRVNFLNRGASNTGKPRISAANLTKMEDGIVEGITKAEARIIPAVTSLPPLPYDGQEVYYNNWALMGDIIWHLRYTAWAASSHKWLVLGHPPPLFVRAATAVNTTLNAYDSFAGGPSITAPLPGDYDADAWCTVFSPDGGNRSHEIALRVNSVVLEAEDGGPSTGYGVPLRIRARRVDVLAGQAVDIVYKSANGTFRRRSLDLTPVRVG